VRRVLVALPHLCCVGMLHDEDWVVNMCASNRNWWIRRHCGGSWLLSIFYDAGGPVMWGYLEVPPGYKKWPMSHHYLRLTPWHYISRISIGFKLEEHIWIQKGGSINYKVPFLIWHITHNGCLAMNAPSQKVGVHVIFHFIVDSI
jgi:hypothetical protein